MKRKPVILTNEILNVAIGQGIQKHVNGQLNKISAEQIKQGERQQNQGVTLDKLGIDFKAHIDVVQPIIENFEENQGFAKTLKRWAINLAIAAGMIGSVGIILKYIFNFKT